MSLSKILPWYNTHTFTQGDAWDSNWLAKDNRWTDGDNWVPFALRLENVGNFFFLRVRLFCSILKRKFPLKMVSLFWSNSDTIPVLKGRRKCPPIDYSVRLTQSSWTKAQQKGRASENPLMRSGCHLSKSKPLKLNVFYIGPNACKSELDVPSY